MYLQKSKPVPIDHTMVYGYMMRVFYYSSMYIVVEYSLIVLFFLILDAAVSQELVAPRSRL